MQRAQQALAGAALLTAGIAIGSAASHDDAPQPAPLAEVAETIPPPAAQLDVAAYHASVIAAKHGRTNITDLLSPPIAAGAETTVSVNLELGARPVAVDYSAPGFETLSLDAIDEDDHTRIVLRARNTSTETKRLTALVQFKP